MNVFLRAAAVLFFGALLPTTAQAHCQVPCGIYDDHARVKSMLEDSATTRKAIFELEQLVAKKDVQSMNQLVRWVMTKEQHAERIIDTISDYFLTQRVKPGQKDYAERLARHHGVMIAAMKVKQNADQAHVDALETRIQALLGYYPEHKH